MKTDIELSENGITLILTAENTIEQLGMQTIEGMLTTVRIAKVIHGKDTGVLKIGFVKHNSRHPQPAGNHSPKTETTKSSSRGETTEDWESLERRIRGMLESKVNEYSIGSQEFLRNVLQNIKHKKSCTQKQIDGVISCRPIGE